MFEKFLLFISVVFTIGALPTKITAQTPPETTINIHSLVTGSGFPNIVKLGNIVIDENQRRAYFTGTISANIGVIDIDSKVMIDTIDTQLEGYLSKYLFVNSSNGILYMFVIETKQLYRIDPVSGAISSPISGESATVDEGTGKVFVADPPNGIQVYDDSLQWISTISDVIAPLDMFVDPTLGRLYVVNSVIGPFGGVTVYNTTTLQLIQHYSMPVGFNGLPTRVHANYGKIYVTGKGPGTLKTLSIIDETTGSGFYVALDETGNQIGTFNNKIFVMTGYPYYAGYLPEADGSYGIIEVRDAFTGNLETELWTDLECVSFDIDESSGNLLFSSTGSGTIGFVNLSDYTTIATIDVATTIEDVIIHPDNGSLYLRNRLGGSTIYRINPETGTLINTLVPGNWPTKILLDSIQNRLYVLSHYEAKIYIYDILTDALIDTISLGVQLPRTDALSTMTIDNVLNKLYVIIPELGTLTMVNTDGSGNPATINIEGFTPDPLGGGPGQLHIAVNSSMNRVFVFIKDTARLNIYNGNSIAQLSYSTISGFSITNPPLNLLFSDDEGNRLFVGPYIVDPGTGSVTGQIPSGKKVVASNPGRTKFYVSDSDVGIQGFIESIYEYDSTLSSIERQWDFSPISVVQSSFGFDFTREKMYVGYFERGELDVFDIGQAPASVIYIPADYLTIQEGLNAADVGTTVIVSAGTYDENLVWPDTDGIVLISETGATNTIIDGSGLDRVIYIPQANSLTNATVINGFTIRNGYYSGAGAHPGGGIADYCGIVIRNNTIKNNFAGGVGGGLHLAGGTPFVFNNLIINNTSNDAGGGIYIYSSAEIRNNTIVGNTATGTGGGGIGTVMASGTIIIEDNIIVNNSADGSSESGGGIMVFWSTCSLDYNDVWGNTPDNYSGCSAGTNSISADPVFVVSGNGDYFLDQDISPCINTGSQTALTAGLNNYTTSSELILDGGQVDIGYHYNPDDFIEVNVNLKVFLEGPFNETDMNTYLNPADIPLSQPYNIAPWNYTGTENVESIPNANIVDWVLVELRDATEAQYATGSTTIARQAAFILNDGSIVGMDGSSILSFNPETSGSINHQLFSVIWHRNHLGVLSANALSGFGNVYFYDFTTGENKAYEGANGHKEIVTDIWGMIATDGNADGTVDLLDKNDVWTPQAGEKNYKSGDYDLNTQVNNPDKNDFWIHNNGSESQVPE